METEIGGQKDDGYSRESVGLKGGGEAGGRGGGGKNRGWRRLEVRWRLISPKSTERQILERNVAG